MSPRLPASRGLNLDEELRPEVIFAKARAAQFEWARLPIHARLGILRRFRVLLAEHAGEIANAVARPAAETLTAQIVPLADAIRLLERRAASWLAPRTFGWRGRPGWLWGIRSEIRREPAGVVLVIAPSNYPILLPGIQVVQALAAGNAVLLKPGSAGRPAAKALRRLLLSAGLDASLLTVLPESASAATQAMALGPDHVVLTGSSSTGTSLLHQAADRIIPCTVELSGCDPVLVRADADPERVVQALRFGWSLNDGATCIAPRRVFVSRSIASAVREQLLRVLASTPVVPVSPNQIPKVATLIAEAQGRGATLIRPGSATDLGPKGPVVLWNVPADLPALREDLFAPVVAFTECEDDDHAIELSRRSPFALGASIFGRNEAACLKMAGELHAGHVTINDLVVPTADPRVPFGGRGRSGFGLTRGREGLLELTRIKVVATRRGDWLPHLEPSHPVDAEFFAAGLRASHGGSPMARLRAFADFVRLAIRRRRTVSS